jgi:hypothetical protein
MAKKHATTMLDAPGIRLQENDVNMDADGGRVVLVADANSLPKELVKGRALSNVTIVLNYREDEPMSAWPTTREERTRRRFRVTITEEVAE